MIELARQIFTEGGVLALVLIISLVCLLIMAYTLYSLVKLKKSDGKTVEIQAASLLRHIEIQADITKNQLRLAELLNQHDTRAAGIGAALNNAVETMQSTVGERNRQLEALPGKVVTDMTPKLEELPKAIEELLEPKIVSLKEDVRALFESLDAKLTESLEAATDRIPAKTKELIREELALLWEKIDISFQDVKETAKRVTLPDEDSEPKADQPEPGEQPAEHQEGAA